jgi:hypothetical protein
MNSEIMKILNTSVVYTVPYIFPFSQAGVLKQIGFDVEIHRDLDSQVVFLSFHGFSLITHFVT